ncbi:hypothetical protein CBS101457_001146 [Exobasidium rhododendri]|nr:hypothetical protein CBS101457_001146 [Exobasidium rhododendri]
MSIFYQALTSTPLDGLFTPTSEEQEDVEASIQSILLPYQQSPLKSSLSPSSSSQAIAAASSIPVPTLNKAQHILFLQKILDPLPAPYVAFDSTRCWLIYWVAHSYFLLGEELPSSLRFQAISTLLHFQDTKNGGFGSGRGQIGHLMATYATIMAMTILGGPGRCPDEEDINSVDHISGKGGWDDIDRPLLYQFLLSLKQPDGSFTVHREGEIDVRATYCVTCISIILGIATPELFEGVGEAVARCQTFEGGLSAASHTSSDNDLEGATLGEAHGGYAYCALATHLSLSFLPDPRNPTVSPFGESGSSKNGLEESISWTQRQSACSAKLDIDKALRWAISQQGIPIEGGGFRGRTNKLVDGCYGWFSGGGIMTILGALVELQQGKWWREGERQEVAIGRAEKEDGGTSDDWESVASDSLLNFESDGCLFDRVALQEYILVIAQSPKGGLRDKPGKNSDAYHTCYNLSGLSLCQHLFELDDSVRRRLCVQYKVKTFEGDELEEWKRCCYSSMLGWKFDTKIQCVLGGDQNRVGITHPIFNAGFVKVKEIMDWSYGQL